MWLRCFLALILPFLGFAEMIDLRQYEKQRFSQNGEDGILEKIFEVLDVEKGYCVEFGAADGYFFSNTLQFRNLGWEALLLDGSQENLGIHLHKEWITKENILDIFAKYQVPSEFDLLSIDIDSNDWYIWRELGKVYHPKVLIIEFNPTCGPYEDMVIEYNSQRTWDGSSTYYGASFTAYFNLGRKLGYSLVAATYLNAIFVRDDLITDRQLKFKDINQVQKIYVGPAECAGHLKHLPFTSAREILEAEEKI